MVHVYDRVLGVPSVVGPFPDPVTAAVFAERYVDEVSGNGDRPGMLRVDVIPLERVARPVRMRSR